MTSKKIKKSVKDYRYFIKILGYEYEVIYTDDANKLMVSNQLCFGLVDYVNQQIFISTQQHPEMMQETLLHEILHAIDHLLNAGQNKLSEEDTDKLATGLSNIVDINLTLKERK